MAPQPPSWPLVHNALDTLALALGHAPFAVRKADLLEPAKIAVHQILYAVCKEPAISAAMDPFLSPKGQDLFASSSAMRASSNQPGGNSSSSARSADPAKRIRRACPSGSTQLSRAIEDPIGPLIRQHLDDAPDVSPASLVMRYEPEPATKVQDQSSPATPPPLGRQPSGKSKSLPLRRDGLVSVHIQPGDLILVRYNSEGQGREGLAVVLSMPTFAGHNRTPTYRILWFWQLDEVLQMAEAAAQRGAGGARLCSLTEDNPLVQTFEVHTLVDINKAIQQVFLPPNPRTKVLVLSTLVDQVSCHSVMQVLPPAVRRSFLQPIRHGADRSLTRYVYSHQMAVR